MQKFTLHTSLVSSNKVRGMERTTISQTIRHSEDTGGSPHAAMGWTGLQRWVPSGAFVDGVIEVGLGWGVTEVGSQWGKSA